MTAEIIWLVMFGIFVALGGYAIGLRRGMKTYENDYDQGWDDCVDYFKENYECTPINDMFSDLEKDYNEEKCKKAHMLVQQLGELFDDEKDGYTYGSMYFPPKEKDNIIDCGEY